MAKGIRSKQRQRWSKLKREVIRNTRGVEHLKSLGTKHYTPKNAFLNPDDPEAVFPQHKVPVRMDFRSDAIMGYECPVKSDKIMKQRLPPGVRKILKGRGLELPDFFMGDLAHTLKSIEAVNSGMNIE